MVFDNPFRRAQAENESGQIIIHVQWGAREKFNIPIPNPATTPLSQLLATLSHVTSIPADQLKLVYKGAVLKDPILTVASYGIQDGAKLTLIGKEGQIPQSTPAPAPQVVKKKNKQPETDTESVLTEWIQNLVNGVLEPLQPSIVTFVSQVDTNATNKPAHIPPFEKLQKEHARLSELLLRGLLDLDGVEIPPDWNEARKARKEGVRALQGAIDKVDSAWGSRKRLGQVPKM